MIKKIIKDFDISDLEFYYEGNHNKTYKGLMKNEPVQIRISKNNIVNHSNEIKFFNSGYGGKVIYIDEFLMIRKWIDGKILDNNSIDFLRKIRCSLEKQWSLKIPNISSFNLNIADDIVLSHGDLRKKNIIVSEDDNIFLIDFEWINYNTKYFDLAHLFLYCSFKINDIVEVFGIEKGKLKREIKFVKGFNKEWLKSTNLS